MTLRNRLIAYGVGAFIALMPTEGIARQDSLGNEIVLPKTQSYIESTLKGHSGDYLEGFSYGIEGLLKTSVGGFGISYENLDGKQRLIPIESNVVTNGNAPRDKFDRERGNIENIGFFYGIKDKFISADVKIDFLAGYKRGSGKTDISNTTPGYMQTKGKGYGAEASVLNVVGDLGAKIHSRSSSVNEKARFEEGLSDEDIDFREIGVSATLPLVFQKISLNPYYKTQRDKSSLIYHEPMPGQILINRDVSHKKEKYGFGVRIYDDFYKKKYLEFIIGAINGNQRHEFASAPTKGFELGFEAGFGNRVSPRTNFLEPKYKFKLGYLREDNSSLTKKDSRDPQTLVPIVLNFNEKRELEELSASFEKKDDYFIEAIFSKESMIGSTDAFVPILNSTLPVASGDYKKRELTINGSIGVNKNVDLVGTYSKEFEFGHEMIGAGIRYNF